MRLIRTLSKFEVMLLKNSFRIPDNFSIVATVTGNINHKMLYIAINKIKYFYEALNTEIKIYNKKFSFLYSEKEIPVKTIHRLNDSQWQDIIALELQAPFCYPITPPIRVFHLHSTEKSDIIVTFHHIIADGISGFNFMTDLISAIDDIINEKSMHERLKSRLLPSIESLLMIEKNCSHISNEYNEDTEILNKLKADPHLINNYSIINFKLTKNETKNIIGYCKLHSIRVSSLLTSIFSKAIFDLQENCCLPILCEYPVNMRKYTNNKPENTQMGYALSRIDTIIPESNNYTLESLAKYLHNNITDMISSNLHIEIIKQIHEISMINEGNPQSNSHENKKNLTTLFMSNIGLIKSNKIYKSLQVESISYSISNKTKSHKDKIFSICTATLNDSMSINFSYDKSTDNNGNAIRIFKHAISLLKNIM